MQIYIYIYDLYLYDYFIFYTKYIQNFRKEENEYITINGNTLPVDARLFSKE